MSVHNAGCNAGCNAGHSHYSLHTEVSELLLHGKNANFVDLFWKNASEEGVWAFENLGSGVRKCSFLLILRTWGLVNFFCCLV